MEPVRVGMIGLGGISHLHEAGYAEIPEQAQIVAVCDVDLGVAEQRARGLGARAYRDASALLADPTIDLVDIMTPHRQHYPLALAAINAGKHVLVEKPMAMRGEDAEHLVRAARERGVRFTVAENTRFVAGYLAAEKLIRAGKLGEIRLVRTFIAGSEAERIRSQASWVGDPDEKGVLHDSGVHTFYLMRWLFGGIREVRAFGTRVLPESRVEDDATIVGRLVNGANFISGQSCIVEAPWTERLEIFGSQGSLIVDQLADPVAKWYNGKDDVDGQPLPDVEYDPLAWKFRSIVAEVQDMIAAIQEGRDPAIDPADGAYAIRVSDAVHAALASGELVTVGAL